MTSTLGGDDTAYDFTPDDKDRLEKSFASKATSYRREESPKNVRGNSIAPTSGSGVAINSAVTLPVAKVVERRAKMVA